MAKKKKRVKVPVGANYLTMAQAYGTTPETLSQMNPGVSTPSSGTYISVPDSPNLAGAPPPPSGGLPYNPLDAITQGQAASTYYQQPPPPQYLASERTYQSIPTGNSLQMREESSYLTPTATKPSVAGGTEGAGVGVSTAPNDIYATDANGNPTLKVVTEEQWRETGMTTDQMQDLGYTWDINTRTWVFSGSVPTVAAPRNPGGWMQTSDGKWRINRSGAQQRKRDEREERKKKANQSGQSSPVNWSI